MKQIIKIAGVTLAIAALLAPALVSAAVLPNPTPPLSGQGVTLSEIEALIQRIAEFLIIFGVIIAVIFIIWGGIMWMYAGGNDEDVEKAKSRIWNGVYGAAIVLGVGVILQTLSRLITRSFFN
ncbi:MAG: hypothetical protein AAB561_00030 [Patescibacteria group bacterium]